MAVTSQNEPSSILREWAPLTDLFTKLPSKAQSGIFFQEIKLTCVDVLPEYLALGTNVGIVYWYDRRKNGKHDMLTLRCESSSPITALRVISTVDYMVACGNKLGNICIFQIPKSHPESIPENLRPKNKKIEKFDVVEHKARISAIEWSQNGMKLFSGDKNGCIVFTEIDFSMHLSKSVVILNESYEVVQLSYKNQHLLVSTIYRSIICHKLDKWKVCQVGKKDRKMLGTFGGILSQQSYKPSDICIYCTRPGLRMWISDIDGNVQKTLLFKDLLTTECSEVPIINPISQNLRSLKPHKEAAFGILLPFNDKLLVTHNNDVVYILDPQEMAILSTISQLRSVLNVATHKDEIFILEEDRSLIRISYRPEPFSGYTFSTENNSFLPLASSIKDLTTKLRSTRILSAIPPVVEYISTSDVNIHIDETMVVNAEEAHESPVKIPGYDQDVKKKFEEIGKQEFEDQILFKKSKHHKKQSSIAVSTSSLSSDSSEEKDLSYTRPTLMNLSAVGILPDLRSPESIKYDIEYKEKILADILSLNRVKMPDSKSDDIKREANKSGHSQTNLEKRWTNENVPSDFTEKPEKLESKNLNKHFQVGATFQIENALGPTLKNKNQDDIAHKNQDDIAHKNHSQDETFKNKNPHDEVTSKTKHQGGVISKNKKPEDDVFKPAEFFGESSTGSKTLSTVSKTPNEMPACMNIPNEWGLSDIQVTQVRERTVSVLSDNSLSDWEIV